MIKIVEIEPNDLNLKVRKIKKLDAIIQELNVFSVVKRRVFYFSYF